MASDDISKAVKDARIAAAFAVGCVFLVGLLLLIDGQRNKVMLGHVEAARRILDEFRAGVQVVEGLVVSDAGTETAAPTVGGGVADSGGTGGDGSAGVVADASAGAGVADPGGETAVPVNGTRARRAGMAGGPRGDG